MFPCFLHPRFIWGFTTLVLSFVLLAGYGVWTSNGVAIFMGLMGSCLLCILLVGPHLDTPSFSLKDALRQTTVLNEGYRVLDNTHRMIRAYQTFKQTGDVRKLTWTDIDHYRRYANEDPLFWNSVDALLNKKHPQHEKYHILAGCPQETDIMVIYEVLQYWWDNAIVLTKNDSLEDEITLYV